MNWPGKSSVFFVTVFALVLTGLFAGAARAAAPGDRSGEEFAFFYPSFPTEGGPYVVAASFWDASASDTTYSGEADSLFVVFNEPVDDTTIDIADFEFTGFTATTYVRTDGVTGRMVVLTDITNMTVGTDSVRVVWNSVTGTDTYLQKDITPVPVTSGPILLEAVLDNGWDVTNIVDLAPNDQSLRLTFDHPVTVVDATNIFRTTPELSAAGVTLLKATQGRYVTVTRTAGNLRMMYPGISKVWLTENDIRWSAWAAGTGQNLMAQKVETDNSGPVLMAAYYNDKGTGDAADDEVWLTFTEPIEPGSLGAPVNQYELFGTWATNFGNDATQRLQPQSADYANVIVVQNPSLGALPVDGESLRVETSSYPLYDYQTVNGLQRTARTTRGVGITRAAYFDRGTDSAADDELHLWFSQPLDLSDVTAYDFEIYPDIADFWTQVTFTSENDALGHVVVSGINNVTALAGARLPNGHLINIDAADSFDGTETAGQGADSASAIPIFDDSQPARIRLTEIPELTYKRYDDGTGADTAFIAWRETSARDDSDQFFLFFTNQATPLDDQFIQNWRNNALAVGNLLPVTINSGVTRCAVNIDTFQVTTDNHLIQHGDQIRFMIVPATYWGVMADGDGDAVLKFETEIIAGPVCPPHDFDEDDDDMIHVIATYDEETETYTHSIFGDIDAAPCGTQIYVFDGPDPFADNELGHGPINSNGSFAPVVLDTTVVDPMEVDPFYVFAWDDGAFSVGVPILNDRVLPVFYLADDVIPNADRFDPPQIYKLADYVNILLQANDQVGDPAAPDTALSDLLAITADFTHLDDRTTLPSSLGSHPVDAVPLVSMGSDEVDNDGDWVADDATIDLDTDGVMDFPEPYFDENGNGVFDPGETFVDRDGDDLCDCVGGTGDDYDLNLDSADPDEHGFYEVRLLASGDEDRYNDVVKGFQLLDPVTDPNGQTSFGEMFDLPVLFDVHDVYLDQTTEYTETEAPFLCEVDEVPPTVAKVNDLYSLGTYTEASVPTDNLILPTDPTYHLARYFNFKMETPSDDDVLFAVTQIRKTGGIWRNLLLDPAGANGVDEFDDDRDGVLKVGGGGQDANGIDDDEDGVIDNEGEGTDLLDAEVVDAVQDSTADANADGGDGIYILTDWRDNDNDAFFIFEPYFDPDGGTGSSAVLQKVAWFNVDERTDNDIDDDFDGYVDDASGHGAAEVETYTASADDNEDGIVDGEAVAVTMAPNRLFAVADSAYGGDIYVAAPEVEGGNPADVENDIRGLTEFVTPAYDVIDPNGILADGTLPGLPWGDDQPATAFTWFDAHNNTNIDFWHIAQLAFGEIPDGTQEYQLRAVAYDQAGNVNADYAVPITFTVDVSAPELALTGCPTGDYPADFVDVSATMDGMQVYDTGTYTLTTQDDLDAVAATFQYRYSYDEGATWSPDWTTLATDVSRPFTTEWTPPTIPLTPPDATVLVELRAFGEDEFGNVQDPDSACVAQLTVIDGMAPWTWFTLIYETENTGHMNVGDMPNPYYYRDVIGPLHVPRGPAIDIWALFSPGEGLASTYDHDVIRVVFEMSLAGSGVWTPFATVTGHVDPDDHTIDLTIPVAVTLETEALETGTYDIRVYACDLEGNNCTPADEAPTVQYDIAKITVVEEGLRAYIQPVRVLDCEEDQHETGMYDLFAINWIHDYDLDHVLFQFYADTDGDGVDNDGNLWFDIATDDDTSADPRGDVVLRRGPAMLDTLTGWVAFRCDSATYHDSLEVFIDYDEDGYSEKDPVILDVDGNYVYDAETDVVVVGDADEIIAEGVYALTCFAEDEFHTGAGFFDPTEWIYRDNHASGQPSGTLNNWAVTWDATGLSEGDYLVRAVATDVTFAVDDTVSSPSVIPVESVRIDPDPPAAVIATVTTPDAVEQAAIDDLYFDATIKWVKVCATTDATDIDHIKIQFRIPGHVTFGNWLDLDLNDDEDFYADIDGIPGLSAEDEIFLDTGTVPYVWDAGDTPLYLGANGVLDAEGMTTPPALTPHMAFFVEAAPADVDTLLEENGVGPADDDHDGMDNEDQFGPNDWYGPYCIYFPVPNLGLISDTNIEFRAVATDQSCNTDPNPAVTRFMFGETDAPETDVVWAKLGDGTEFDVLPLISDGTDVTHLTLDDIADPVTMLVTSEDETAITQVDLKFRKASECYGLDEWENPWISMSAEGFTVPPAPDQNYDYLFTVDLGALEAEYGYGVYEFYPEAQDNEGNVTPPPVNPYQFKIMTNYASLEPLSDDEAAPGDELWFDATLAEPADDAMVTFMYAERLLDEVIDATRITPDPDHATFQTPELEESLNEPAAAVLTLNGTPGTYFADVAALIASGQPGDWTYDGTANAIEFAVRPEATDEILISYNISGWDTISTDDDAPYTGAWDQPSGGVPTPYNPNTDAYDVIAVLTIGSGECALTEAAASEGILVHLVDEEAPDMWLYGLGLCNADPLDYWPGNPSFDSVAGLTEWKLSGIEHEMFVTTDDDVTSVDVVVTGPFNGATETRIPMTQVLTDALPMTFTMYESDFPDVMYGFENVGLSIMGDVYPMTEVLPGVWQVSGIAVPVGEETQYAFAIDQDGNDWDDYIPDPRNQREVEEPAPLPVYYSSVKLPPAGFWFVSGFDFGDETAVWKVRAEATDGTGNVGVTRDYSFVYDPVAPTIDAVTATSLRFNENEQVTVHATITDPVPATFDVITVKHAWFQYSPNFTVGDRDRYERVWLDFGNAFDTDPTDGWSMTGYIPDPEHDGFDNDGDGIWDEPDESEPTSAMAFRVIAMDDGHNYGTPYELEFTLDSMEPAALLTSPIDGAVYPYHDADGNGITIPLTAEITETEADIAYVQFQFDAGDGWQNVDITPEDGSDHPWDGTEPYAVDFLTTNYLDEEDTYVRFRAVAVDMAGNEDGDAIEVLVVINDVTGPTAFPIWARTSGAAEYMHLTDPHVAVRGHDARIKGTAIDPSGRENLATVTVQYQLDGTSTWTDIAIVPSDEFVTDGFNDFTVGWEVVWDVTLLAEGTYHIRAIAADLDGNADPDPIQATLRVDHTPPPVRYEEIAGLYAGFAPHAAYEDDGTSGTSNALTPDPETEDLTFFVLTSADDVHDIVLQWHQEGTHDLGQWEDFGELAAFDYEPNLDFSYGGTTYHVWQLHVDNFVDYCTGFGISGVMELRALATDYAHNQNILHDADNPWTTWTIDIDNPVGESLTDNLTDHQVESGQPVHLNGVFTDATTDVDVVRFEYSADGVDWTVIDPDPATAEIEAVLITGENVDTEHCRWLAEIDWYTPYPLVQDTQYHVRAVFYDTAGNEGTYNGDDVTVEDNIKPDLTKIWAIPAVVSLVSGRQDGEECVPRPGVFIDKNENGRYDILTDVAIDLGAMYDSSGVVPVLEDTLTATGTLGDAMATWPRYVDEVVLGGEIIPMLARTVTLVGRTQIDDTGLMKVEFWAVNAAGDRILIGTDECPPAYTANQYFWHVDWNTLETDAYGDPKYPDGTYTLVPIAYDLEGNVEDWPVVLSAEASTVIVDNTAPTGIADANAATEEVETAITIERNDVFQMFARTATETEDDILTFYTKRAADLNMDASWTVVPEDEGLDASDQNPDETRPYVFDWDLDKMDEPFPLEDPVVGVPYHFVAPASDILNNAETALEAFAADHYVTFTVVDTRAPVATITEIQRVTGNTTVIELPHMQSPIYARDLAYMKAKILELDNDTEKVEFMYALPGQTQPTLIDADVVRDPDEPYTWRLSGWDLSPLAGQTLEVFAVATDDVGNADFNPTTGRPIAGPVFTLIVDYTAPEVTVIRPVDGMKECRDDVANEVYQLLFSTLDVDIDPETISWCYKLSRHTPEEENWQPIFTDILFDAGTGVYAGNWDLHVDTETLLASDLYDVRLRVTDYAGNPIELIAAQNVVIDTTDPWGEMTRVVLNGVDYYPTMDIDISAGDVIGLWATGHDLTAAEQGKPLHTGISQVIFQAAACVIEGEPTWRDLGFWQPPTGTIYEEVTATIDWNTSGMGEGDYWVRAVFVDDECNAYESGTITLSIFDIEPPRARIAAIQPWRIPHGDDQTTFADIYAYSYSDDEIAEVQFQYSTDGETWIPFGLAQDPSWGDLDDSELCNLWYSQIDLRTFAIGQNVWLRAVAKDEMENQDAAAPILATTLVRLEDGTLNLVPGDLGEVADPEFVMMGYTYPEELVVSVTMTHADQVPLVMWTWPMPEHEGGGAECLEMKRMIDNPLVWRGDLHLPETDCGPVTIYANALVDGQIDLHSTTAWSYEVDRDLGTNGTVTAIGYPSADDEGWLHATGNFPDASGGIEGCFMIAPSVPPTMSADQARFMTMLDRTCYFMAMIEDYEEHDINPNYWPTMSIEYDEAALIAACDGDVAKAAEMEQYLTVREANWYEWNGEWSGTAITHVTVDPVANKVTFMCKEVCYLRPFFALFVPAWDAPVRVISFTPSSPDPNRWNVTDRDPIIAVDLNSIGAEDIDRDEIEVWIDGNLVATNYWHEGTDGWLDVMAKDEEGLMYRVVWHHPTNREWRLGPGAHTLNVMYKTTGVDEWINLPANAPGATFYVDAAPPTIELHSGFAANPALHNADGYILPGTSHMLGVRLYDAGSGVLVEPMRLSDGQDEMGIKYDLWVVDHEDDQWGVDEYEERILLHTGTASEIVPFVEPPVYDSEGTYCLADESILSIPTVAGGHLIADGDILEVVLYTKKHVEEWVDSWEGCDGGLIWQWDIMHEMPPDTIASIYWDCYVDNNIGLHVYEQGILDWAGNVGAEFAEYRFVVDMAGPQPTLVSPANGITDPGVPFCFELAVADGGSGVNTADVKLIDGDGSEIELTNVILNNGKLTGCTLEALPLGTYTLTVTTTDRVGNTTTTSYTIIAESRTLGVTEAYLGPNPVNPSLAPATLFFTLSRASHVTVKVYDFAGDFVSTLVSNQAFDAGNVTIPWAGEAEDGSALANGAYMIRVEAFDGAARQATTVKAVIWRE